VPIRLELRTPLTTAHGVIATRTGAVIELVSTSGVSGWGEALPLPGFGLESADEAVAALAKIGAALVGRTFDDLDAALDRSDAAAPRAKSARAAADIALHDLVARTHAATVAALLARSPRERISVSALVGDGDIQAAAIAAQREVSRGYTTLKLKLGSAALEHDLERIAAVRSAIGAAPRLRLDANGAWDEATACEAARRFADYDIELIEQPVAADDVAALARVRAASPIPIAADEAVRDPASAARLLAARAADVLVLKPAAIGGLRAARRISDAARRAGIGVLVTSFLDSSLGIAAALQLAAISPDSDYAAGLATADSLATDLARPCAIASGVMMLPQAPGLGCRPESSALAERVCGNEWAITG
jgi:o-succinylbenzoate synthase